MTNIALTFGSAVFSSVINTYTTPGSANETVPYNSRFLTLQVGGAGAGGGAGNGGAGNGGGGGEGGYATKDYTISSADWGQPLAYVVGAHGVGQFNAGGSDGGQSTCTGTLNFASISLTGTGGKGGGFFDDGGDGGAGGTGSGLGSPTTISGNPGQLWSDGGLGGGGASIAGDGGNGEDSAFGGDPGDDGIVVFAWT